MKEVIGDRISDIPVDCYTDNKSLEDSLHSTKTLENKRLILDMATIRDMLQSKEIRSVRWIDKHDQLADCLTKQTASSQVLQQVLQSGKLHFELE
jgi:predicted RNase H-like nuclease